MKGSNIQGKRISLGPVKISDAPELGDYYNQTYYLLGQSGANTRKQTRAFIKGENEKKHTHYWALRLNGSNKVIGAISLRIKDKGIGVTGTMIGENFTNKGYGTEAKHMVLRHAFHVLGMVKLFSEVFSYNPRSKAYSLKCGYVHETTITANNFHNEKYWDQWILSITKKQWEPVWEKYKKKHELI